MLVYKSWGGGVFLREYLLLYHLKQLRYDKNGAYQNLGSETFCIIILKEI